MMIEIEGGSYNAGFTLKACDVLFEGSSNPRASVTHDVLAMVNDAATKEDLLTDRAGPLKNPISNRELGWRDYACEIERIAGLVKAARKVTGKEKRGRLKFALSALVNEHDMHEVVWMLGQILEDRGERLTFSGSSLDIDGEQLRDKAVVVGGEYK